MIKYQKFLQTLTKNSKNQSKNFNSLQNYVFPM